MTKIDAVAVLPACYENGPEGMPRVERMPYAVLETLIETSLFKYIAHCHASDGEDRDRLHALMRDVAEEVLARVPAWPMATHVADGRESGATSEWKLYADTYKVEPSAIDYDGVKWEYFVAGVNAGRNDITAERAAIQPAGEAVKQAAIKVIHAVDILPAVVPIDHRIAQKILDLRLALVAAERAAPISEGSASAADENAYNEAANLAKAIYSQHYRNGTEEWHVLPDIRGVISQISNMVAGMTRNRAQQEAKAEQAVAKEAAIALWNGAGEQLQKADDTLRALSSYVGQGLCADTENLDYDEMESRIKAGIDSIVRVERSRHTPEHTERVLGKGEAGESPPLPECWSAGSYRKDFAVYTGDQMQAYGKLCRDTAPASVASAEDFHIGVSVEAAGTNVQVWDGDVKLYEQFHEMPASVTSAPMDALRSIRDLAAFMPEAAVFYRKAENALAGIECRDAVPAPTAPAQRASIEFGYECGVCVSDKDGGGTISLHYKTIEQAEHAFDVISKGIDTIIKGEQS